MMDKPKNSCNWLYVKIGASSLGVVSGVVIFIPFLFTYHNHNAALWGLFSGIFAAICLHLHILFLRNVLHKHYSSKMLSFMKVIGAAASIITLTAFCTYIGLAIVNKQGYKIDGYGYAPAATFSFMTFKWTFMLFWDGGKYQRFLERSPDGVITPLLSGVQINPATDIGYSSDEKKDSSVTDAPLQNGSPGDLCSRSTSSADPKV